MPSRPVRLYQYPDLPTGKVHHKADLSSKQTAVLTLKNHNNKEHL